MTDFLLELLSEEIPARMQERARDDLARLFAAEIGRAGLAAGAIQTYATPRRLALIARGLPDATQAVQEEVKGPRASAPPQALDGFLRKTGLARDQLTERDGVYFAVTERPGRPTAAVLAEAIPAIVRAFPWPKSMRWGAASADPASLRWVRPLSGIVALFGDAIVDCAVDGVVAGAATVGHRFHHPGSITLGGADDYLAKLRATHVIVDGEERREIIRREAAARAAEAGLHVLPDEGLVAENAGLTEWPVPLVGRFDPAFLQVPREVIQLTMRTNQKYFALTDAGGALAPAFVCVANIEARDGGAAIVAGNEKVLSARLSDARFFWEQDLKVPLKAQAAKLKDIVFHEKLGTVADKVDRVAKLARWLVKEGVVKPLPAKGGVGEGQSGIGRPDGSATSGETHPPTPSLGREGEFAALAERAARLCKADLVTGMVGEFPELQGVVGGYLAAAQGEPAEVAEAIRDHYKPVGQGDDVPTAPVTVAVSLADKLDTIGRFFAIEEYPTGSKDPFALRRAALGITSLVVENGLRLSYANAAFIGRSDGKEIAHVNVEKSSFYRPLMTLEHFFADRLKVQQREAGVRHDLIDAVFALGGEDDLVRLLARVRALQAFVETEDGANLLAGYKRAANILRIEEKRDAANPQPVIPAKAGIHSEQEAGDATDGAAASPGLRPDDDPPMADTTASSLTKPNQSGYTPLPEEAALAAALDTAEPAAAAAVEREAFEDAMRALAGLRGPIDAFFDKVTVNDPDEAKRAARLALLGRVRDAVHRVADFSRIEG